MNFKQNVLLSLILCANVSAMITCHDHNMALSNEIFK